MKDETAIFLKSMAAILIGVVVFASVSILTGAPASIRLPWDSVICFSE